MHKLNAQTSNVRVETVCFGAVVGVASIGIVNAIQYLFLGMALPLAMVCLIQTLFVLTALLAWQSRIPAVLLAVGVPALMLGCTTNYLETTLFNFGYFLQAGIAVLATVAGSVLSACRRTPPRRPNRAVLAATLLLLASAVAVWQIGIARGYASAEIKREVWAAPSQLTVAGDKPGVVEAFSYQTKAYATDSRDVEKTAYVYLPYGYDASKQYNVLYLMHGTGDNEASWLIEHSENKNMLDQMIAKGAIEPLIVVTPTFYVEDDCADALDALTYSFAKELRNDLMPAVEGAFATYAESCDAQGFAASREHRAFAGLSRGAVTTYHSVFCGSLDYFSWFGTFSGSRTDAEYFRQTIQAENFANYPINYLYVSSGYFDFALPGQIRDYKVLTAMEPRLVQGENTTFDIFPMQYHSWGNWNLALYNFLQKIF